MTANLRNRPAVRKGISLGLLFTVPIIVFYLMEFYLFNPFEWMAPAIHALNILFFELVMLSLLFLFKKGRTALWVETLVFALFGLANYFVVRFRSAPIMPWDILSLRTAASVADNYSYMPDWQALWVIILFLLCLAASSFCDISISSAKARVSGALVSLVLLLCFVRYTQSDDCLSRFRLYDKLFTPTTMVYKDGTVVAFCLQLQYIFVEEPAGYSAEKAGELLSGDEAPKEEASGKLPHIIVVMNEAFSDLGLLGEFSASEDYMPFVRGMLAGREDTLSGYLDVSVLGGNTANTEFEFLTGLTMAFLPQGSIPYQQYIQGDTFSLASWLKELGYSTIAIHPYRATGWQRHQAYPYLGFDRFLSLEDFSDAGLIRKYVSDKSDYEKIIDVYESGKEDGPLFIFNVTMQNHSSYTTAYGNFTPHITVEGSDSFALSQYLSLLSVSDAETERLIRYFDGQEEETLILFFGDHQPTDSVVKDIWDGEEEADALRYQVPFFLWANYDIPEATGLSASVNYLGNLLLSAAGLPLSPLHSFLEELRQSYPRITAARIWDADNSLITDWRQEEGLVNYAIVQYHRLMEED